MNAIQIKDADGVTDAQRRAMVEGREKLRQHLASKMNPNVLIQPDGSCVFRDPFKRRRPPLSGHVSGPDGVPEVLKMVAEHNRNNRARVYDRVRGWDRAFKVGQIVDVFQVRFRVARLDLPDVLALDPIAPMSVDHEWESWFGECLGKLVPLQGYTLCIQDVYVDQLHLRIVGR
jgi:hypothetical protein